VNDYIQEDPFQLGIPTLFDDFDDFDDLSASNDWFLYYSSPDDGPPLSSFFPTLASTDGFDSSLSAKKPDRATTATLDDHEKQSCVARGDHYSSHSCPPSATVPHVSPEIVAMLSTPDLQSEPAASPISGVAVTPSRRSDEPTTFVCHQCPDREPFQHRHLYK
jgi:hypothetical protein